MKKVGFIILSFIAIKADAGNNGISTYPASIKGTNNTIEFIENKGQVADMGGHLRPDILYVGNGVGAKIYLRKSGLSYVMTKIEGLEDEHTKGNGEQEIEHAILKGHRVDVEFIGANPLANIKKEDPTPEYFNYYLAHCPNGITNVKAYTKIAYEEIYKNIDIAFYGAKQGGLEYDFIVKPGGDPSVIALRYIGMDNISLSEGKLKIKTTLGELTEWMPKVYQKIEGKIVDVEARYEIIDMRSEKEKKSSQCSMLNTQIQFKLGTYNLQHPLIIDPWVTFYGGDGYEGGRAVATDSDGNLLVTGPTTDVNFPDSGPGAFQKNLKGAQDDFIIKFDPSGSRQWATYCGGTGHEESSNIAIDSQDNIIIAALTRSTDFPVTYGAFRTAKTGGTDDAFAIKFDKNGIRQWATYYGGSGGEYGYGIATDATDNIIISGSTSSTDFPVSGTAFQPGYAGGMLDAFAIMFNSNGNYQWCTYIGGSANESGYSIAVDGNNHILITGYTNSTDFPATSGTAQPIHGGGVEDAFIIKLDNSGNRIWATYYGGTSVDKACGIDTDNLNNVVITGVTYDTGFPTTSGAFQVTNKGIEDAFIVKFSGGGALIWATLVGGSGTEEPSTIAIDANNNIYIYGDTYSLDFPVTSCAFQTNREGAEDPYISKFDVSGNILCSGYFGGSAHEETLMYGKIATYGNYLYITGTEPAIGATDFPVTSNAYQPSHKGGVDIFIAQLCGSSCGLEKKSPVNFIADQTDICVSTVNYTNLSTTCDNIGTTWSWFFPGGTPVVSLAQNPTIIYSAPGTYAAKLIITTPCGKDSLTRTDIFVYSPTLNVSPDVSITEGSSTILNATGGGTYSWSPEIGLSCVACQSPVASPQVTTTYYVTITDASSCTATDSVVVTVEIKCGELLVPTAFSPNDDGQNDLLFVRSNCIKTMEFSIYNRWGEKVFTANGINQAWDGMYKGKRMNTSIFTYQLIATITTGETISKKGNITLIR